MEKDSDALEYFLKTASLEAGEDLILENLTLEDHETLSLNSTKIRS